MGLRPKNPLSQALYVLIICHRVLIFLALLQQWWEIWGTRDTPAWTFFGLLMMLAGPIGLFLIAHLIFPERIAEANTKSYYFNEMGPVSTMESYEHQ